MSSVARNGSSRSTDALIVGAAAVTLGVAYLPGVSSWLESQGTTCPLLRLCGWQCPFCGMTRGTIALLHGDLGAVLRTNPFAIVYVLGLVLMIASVLGFRLELSILATQRLIRLSLAVCLPLFVAYSVARNVV